MGAAGAGMVLQLLWQPEETVKDDIQIFVNLSVGYADYAPAARSQICVSTAIICLLFVGTVRCAIDFDDNPRERARKIRHIRSDRMLAAEMHSVHCATADSRP